MSNGNDQKRLGHDGNLIDRDLIHFFGPDDEELDEEPLETEDPVKTFNFNKKSPVSWKIRKLMQEGKPQKHAVAIALKMNSEGRLGPRGGYLKNPKPQRCSSKVRDPKTNRMRKCKHAAKRYGKCGHHQHKK